MNLSYARKKQCSSSHVAEQRIGLQRRFFQFERLESRRLLAGDVPGTGVAQSAVEISSGVGGGPSLPGSDQFGSAVASLGDLDGDGVEDLAVGAHFDSTGGVRRGAVYILFMNADGTAKSSQKIASGLGGGPALGNVSLFGSAVAALGDLDGDGITEIAVGADSDSSEGRNRGAVYVLFMNADGTAKSSQKIASEVGGGPALANFDRFGFAAAGLGDLDGDGVPDMGVCAIASNYIGDTHILFMNADGTAKDSVVLDYGPPPGDNRLACTSIASLGDADGDGVTDIAVGRAHEGIQEGAIDTVFLNSDGSVKGFATVEDAAGGGPQLPQNALFGSATASLGDLNGDGVYDIAVGARGEDAYRGVTYVLFMNADGTAQTVHRISNGVNGGPALGNQSFFGKSASLTGDLNGDGVRELVVGAYKGGAGSRGAVYVLFMEPAEVIQPTAEVEARNLFYGGSFFAEADAPAAAGQVTDDAAIASDKVPLLPGETATFANYTSYSRGINGIMIDIANLANEPTLEAVDDFFLFTSGNDDTPDDWVAAATPSAVTVRAGEGVNGSDRVTILWDDNAIENTWLEVRVLANTETGLESDDVFYFGNAIGDSGNSTSDASVNAQDIGGARDNPHNFLDRALVDDGFDYNRDSLVNAQDIGIARDNPTNFLNDLNLITVPAAAPNAANGLALARPDGSNFAPILPPRPNVSIQWEYSSEPVPGEFLAPAEPGQQRGAAWPTATSSVRADSRADIQWSLLTLPDDLLESLAAGISWSHPARGV